MNTIQPLTPEEKLEMRHLEKLRSQANQEYWDACEAATAAVVKRNRAKKKRDALIAKWLPLIERDNAAREAGVAA